MDEQLRAVAFPKFSPEELASLDRCPCTKHRHFRDGETLFEAGQRNFSFFVVKSGHVDIVDVSDDPPKTIAVHGPGQFSGDVAQLTGSPAIVTAVARGDTEAYELVRDALRQLVNLHPSLGDRILQAFLARRQLLRESGDFTGLRVIGSRYSQDTFRVRDFLSRNRVPYTWLDVESDPHVKDLLKSFDVTEADTPVVAWGHKLLLRNPSDRELADVLGLRRPIAKKVYDLVVVGAGPAGLAAAVYGASEGLSTIVLERSGPGGQAGRSMRIENYLGFPAGITGSDLTERAVLQADKFGACMTVPAAVVRLAFDETYSVLHMDAGEEVTAKCLLIATGAEYRRLGVDGCEPLEGRGVYYAATPTEAQMCRASDVIVVGGGNSAGQAVVYLAEHARKVFLVIRHHDLYRNMSSYLAQRIERTPNVEILRNSEIVRMVGDGHLGSVVLGDKKTGEKRTIQTPAVFSFIGAVPRTDWLPPEVERDEKGFVRTGPELPRSNYWTPKRPPLLLETSRPGVFAAGDVRSGSIKRVASADGRGRDGRPVRARVPEGDVTGPGQSSLGGQRRQTAPERSQTVSQPSSTVPQPS
jgi:thioredoxin reductase (NADPH)